MRRLREELHGYVGVIAIVAVVLLVAALFVSLATRPAAARSAQAASHAGELFSTTSLTLGEFRPGTGCETNA